MSYSEEKLRTIYDSTAGRCHLCHEDLDFDKYADQWEVDHLAPRSRGGRDDLENLRPAHPHCNRKRQDRPPSEVRREHGVRGLPLSRKELKRRDGAYVLGTAKLLIGVAATGLPEAIGVAIIGSILGYLIG